LRFPAKESTALFSALDWDIQRHLENSESIIVLNEKKEVIMLGADGNPASQFFMLAEIVCIESGHSKPAGVTVRPPHPIPALT